MAAAIGGSIRLHFGGFAPFCSALWQRGSGLSGTGFGDDTFSVLFVVDCILIAMLVSAYFVVGWIARSFRES
jgi:hypothetical protein